jgi:hypothetical protein
MTRPGRDEVGFTTSELEESLNGPEGAETKARVLHRLAELEEELGMAIRSGLSTKQHEIVKKTIMAIATARKLMLRFHLKGVKIGE